MKKVRAQDLWFAILDAQTETGNPYMMYKVSVDIAPVYVCRPTPQ